MYPVRKRNIQNLLHPDLSEIFLPLFESQSCWRDLRPGTERTADARLSGSLSDSPKWSKSMDVTVMKGLCRRDLGSLAALGVSCSFHHGQEFYGGGSWNGAISIVLQMLLPQASVILRFASGPGGIARDQFGDGGTFALIAAAVALAFEVFAGITCLLNISFVQFTRLLLQ